MAAGSLPRHGDLTRLTAPSVLEYLSMSTTSRPVSSPAHRAGPTAADGAGSRVLATWWGDRSVAAKVLTAIGVATLVAVLIGVLGMQSLSTAADRTEQMYDEN